MTSTYRWPISGASELNVVHLLDHLAFYKMQVPTPSVKALLLAIRRSLPVTLQAPFWLST